MLEQYGSRRVFISQSARSGVSLLLGGMMLSGCGTEKPTQEKNEAAASADPCSDLSEVPEGEIQKRKNLGYVEESPIADNQCGNCNLYLPPVGDNKCSGCMLFQGPVKPEAYCTYWAPKV